MVKRLGANADVFIGIVFSLLILVCALTLGETDRLAMRSMVVALATAGVVLQLALFIWIRRCIDSRIQAQLQRLRAEASGS